MRPDQTPVRERNIEETDDEIIHYFTISTERELPIYTLVLKALEDVTNRPMDEIEPLYHRINPEALDRLFQSRFNGQPRGEGEVTFPVDECQVTVTAHKRIVVKEKCPAQ